jgi:hypothetical protein
MIFDAIDVFASPRAAHGTCPNGESTTAGPPESGETAAAPPSTDRFRHVAFTK